MVAIACVEFYTESTRFSNQRRFELIFTVLDRYLLLVEYQSLLVNELDRRQPRSRDLTWTDLIILFDTSLSE